VRQQAKEEVEREKDLSARSPERQTLVLLQGRMNKAIRHGGKLSEFEAVSSSCAKSRRAQLTKQCADMDRQEQKEKSQEWMCKRNLGEAHLNQKEVDLLRCWFKSLDTNKSGTISFRDMLDPLFESGQHKISNLRDIVALLRRVKVLHERRNDPGNSLMSCTGTGTGTGTGTTTEAMGMDESSEEMFDEMPFAAFITLCKRAMHHNATEIKTLLKELKGVLGDVAFSSQLPTDLTISIAR
jgi:hypothetical protein